MITCGKAFQKIRILPQRGHLFGNDFAVVFCGCQMIPRHALQGRSQVLTSGVESVRGLSDPPDKILFRAGFYTGDPGFSQSGFSQLGTVQHGGRR